MKNKGAFHFFAFPYFPYKIKRKIVLLFFYKMFGLEMRGQKPRMWFNVISPV